MPDRIGAIAARWSRLYEDWVDTTPVSQSSILRLSGLRLNAIVIRLVDDTPYADIIGAK
jgi:hypothetical protein